jgi:serine/threonine-protein kinase
MASFRKRMELWSRTAFYVFILGAAAFLSAITTMRIAIQGREVEVPGVAGMRAGDAQAALAGRGLGMRIADRVYSEQPVDYVVRQSPPARTRVKVGQRAHVVLSLGPRRVPIPAYVGRSARAARVELLRAGLQVGEISACYLADYETDVVVQQNPLAGSTEAGSPRVNLLVSLGSREPTFVMPDLEGLALGEAQRRINAAELHLAKATSIPAPGALSGAVVAQQPARGARIVAGIGVELQIAQ